MRASHIILVCIVAYAFILSGCSGNWDSYPLVTAGYDNNETTIIEAGDSLNVTVFGEPDLSGTYTLMRNGAIDFPLTGAIQLQGLNIKEGGQRIMAALQQQGYLVNPNVSLALSNASKTVRIMGEVLNTGEYSYEEDLTVLALVANAGGFSYRAKQEKFDIIRKDREGSEKLIVGTLSTKLKAGDIVRVRERFF